MPCGEMRTLMLCLPTDDREGTQKDSGDSESHHCQLVPGQPGRLRLGLGRGLQCQYA